MRLLLLNFSMFCIKVIPLKKKEYLEFSKTWSSSYLYYEYYKNAIKNGGHRARFCVTWMAIMINI